MVMNYGGGFGGPSVGSAQQMKTDSQSAAAVDSQALVESIETDHENNINDC